MTTPLTRTDRLFVLATICSQRNITPNDTRYMGLISGICAANFQLPKAKAKELAQILTTAYRHDKWQNILGETPTKQQTPPTTLEAYNQKDRTPKQDAVILKGMAKKDTYDGVGRLIHKEIQLELGNLTPEEIVETWQTYNHKDTIEQNNNIYLIYWGGKQKIEDTRNLRPILWNPTLPTLEAEKPLAEEVTYEKDSDIPKQNGVGEVIEETDGIIEEQEE